MVAKGQTRLDGFDANARLFGHSLDICPALADTSSKCPCSRQQPPATRVTWLAVMVNILGSCLSGASLITDPDAWEEAAGQ
jgi:hypothetical protein